MTRVLPVLLIIFVQASAGASAPAPRQIIQGELTSMDAAFARHDIAGGYRYFAPDYTRVGPDGKQYVLADDLAGARAALKVLQTSHSDMRVESCDVSGKTARVVVELAATMTFTNVKGKTFPDVHLSDSETRDQIWVKSAGMWLLQTTRTVSSKLVMSEQGMPTQTVVDGKVVGE
jgi:hypothetical protein